MQSRQQKATKKLIHAARNGSVKMVAAALDHGADINLIPDGSHATALLYAAANGKIRIVIMLLENGANTEMTSINYAWNALHAAAARGYYHIVALFSSRIDINSLTNEGCSPINLAASEGHTTVVKQLLKLGANSKQANKFNSTPLFIAAVKGHDECVEILVVDLITKHKDNPQELLNYLNTNNELHRCLSNAKNSASRDHLLKLEDFRLKNTAKPYRNPFDDVIEAQAVPVAVAAAPERSLVEERIEKTMRRLDALQGQQASLFFPPKQNAAQQGKQEIAAIKLG